ncbi:putative 3-oxoacyl-(acyl-carrier protein) reductase [metagenome]|uniref:Putative 3-oxoacyl-(Acyl-carrier protein) reductase n=1 Tax=metagenome TaxID=256318 RepID=A0A2P2CD69_9ZZZZ
MGAATARRLADEGGTVELADVDETRGREVAASIGSAAWFVRVDVRDEESICQALQTAVDLHGRIDCAAHVAGRPQEPGSLIGDPDAQWDDLMAVNARGLLWCLRHEAHHMIKSGAGGSIVNVTSAAGLKAFPGLGMYSVSKHAGVGLTANAASELTSRGLRVNGIAPGAISTPMLDGLPHDVVAQFAENHPMGRFGSAAEVAGVAAFLLSGDAGYVSG